MREQVLYGTSVMENCVPAIPGEKVHFPGTCYSDGKSFGVNERILSRHLLLLGGSGCGKTNTFQFAMNDILGSMSQEDIAIVFDTKGEFYQYFSKPGDYVIGNSPAFRQVSHTWNIFQEVLADEWSEYAIQSNAREISAALFHGRGSSSQPFFCNAAKDIFTAMLLHFLRQAKADPQFWKPRLNNKDLKQAFASFQAKDYVTVFKGYPDMRYLLTYIGDGTSNQALGVFGELNSMLSEFFVGILADNKPDRSISMRDAVRKRAGKTIFIEYDLAMGETLVPVYRLLVDQALKEALGRGEAGEKKTAGNCYLFADEFKLLPKLQHIDDALNFGRGLGVRVMAGIQSISQLYDIYGENRGKVLASGFGSIFGFHTNDDVSRNFLSSLMGKNVVLFEYVNRMTNTTTVQQREGQTLEEWTQIDLGVGQAVVALADHAPFLYQFDEYKR